MVFSGDDLFLPRDALRIAGLIELSILSVVLSVCLCQWPKILNCLLTVPIIVLSGQLQANKFIWTATLVCDRKRPKLALFAPPNFDMLHSE